MEFPVAVVAHAVNNHILWFLYRMQYLQPRAAVDVGYV
jgi:hypothetical protein